MLKTQDIQLVTEACAALGEPVDFRRPAGYPGLALCVMDSIWSMGVRYEGVKNVVERYRTERALAGFEANSDTPRDLVAFIEDTGGALSFAETMKNRQLTSPRGGILKAEAVLRAARELATLDINTAADLSAASPDRFAEVEARWAAVPGQGSRISWTYFLMLSGAEGVKADRMVRRFIADALDRESAEDVGVKEATDLVTAAAERLGIGTTTLDYQIWLYQRSQG